MIVPYAKKNGTGPELIPLELSKWEKLQIDLTLKSDGRVFSSGSQ